MSYKRLPRRTTLNQSNMFEVSEQVKGVWVQILVAEATTRTVTHNMLHMQLSWRLA
jgi:hypothetical protein